MNPRELTTLAILVQLNHASDPTALKKSLREQANEREMGHKETQHQQQRLAEQNRMPAIKKAHAPVHQPQHQHSRHRMGK